MIPEGLPFVQSMERLEAEPEHGEPKAAPLRGVLRAYRCHSCQSLISVRMPLHLNIETTEHFGGTSHTVPGNPGITSVCSLHFLSRQHLAECETNIGDKGAFSFFTSGCFRAGSWIHLKNRLVAMVIAREGHHLPLYLGDTTGSVGMLRKLSSLIFASFGGGFRVPDASPAAWVAFARGCCSEHHQ